MKPGSTLLLPSGTYHNPDVKHLYVVCTAAVDGSVALVSVSSWKNDLCDGTCVLEAGCHPFIKHKSYILYRKSIVEKVSTLEKGVAEKELVLLEQVSEDILKRAREGLLSSPHTPKFVKKFARKSGVGD